MLREILKIGGYIFVDDTNWVDLQPAVAYLKNHCRYDEKGSYTDRCMLFQKK